MSYNHIEIDAKWQKIWEEKGAFRAEDGSSKPKFYALDMFPYPSGAGLHIGHMASYTPTDVVSRYKRSKGFNVLHPMGYDAFGLPAEQYAIQTGIHPSITTQKSINRFREQLKFFGFSFDWSREISTAEPDYYKWTQFIFSKLFEKGLAYQKEVPVNWCPELKTVLANEEVVDGKSERGGHPVVRMPMKQWMLKITAYADRLIKDLDKVNWPARTKEAQINWIGKSEGASVQFKLDGFEDRIEVFTTRPDTLFGVSFMVLSPEHPLVAKITSPAQKAAVEAYRERTSHKSEVERKTGTEKTGVFTGANVVHPFTGKAIPIWIADYVLMDYGTGAIMAVPGHDTRDFEFAEKFSLPVLRVLESDEALPFEGDGKLCNSEFLNGLDKKAAIEKMIFELESRKLGVRRVEFKLRDWLFSRQRYWGEPFPVVHLENGKTVCLPVDELPVRLPEVANYEPSEKGEAPLARAKDWVQYNGKAGKGVRETDTMPGTAGSGWYFLRFIDPRNANALVDFAKQKYWMPVDLYVGGPEHTVSHLLYARFWQKVLFDVGLTSVDEPFQQLAHQGMILGTDGEKMSKSRGNVVNPDELREKYGADALRTFILFLGPLDRDKPWNERGIDGSLRFLERVWRLAVNDQGEKHFDNQALPEELLKLVHKTVKKVGGDIETLSFNTAISALMILVNEAYRLGCKSSLLLKPLVQMLAPFAPHVAEELWQRLGETSLVATHPWPSFDPKLVVDDVVTMGVQVNGKARGSIEIAVDASEEVAVGAAKLLTSVQNAMQGKAIEKVIYKAGRILNIIVK